MQVNPLPNDNISLGGDKSMNKTEADLKLAIAQPKTSACPMRSPSAESTILFKLQTFKTVVMLCYV